MEKIAFPPIYYTGAGWGNAVATLNGSRVVWDQGRTGQLTEPGRGKNLDADEKALMVYTTIGGLADAEKLGDELVNRGLAACVNIIPGVLSIYEAGGRTVHDHEAIMIVKSRQNLKTRLLDGLKRLHPYELPAIFVIEPDECDEAYMDWIRLRTSKRGKGVN